MQNNQNTREYSLDEWMMRVRIPEGGGPHPVLLLLHGWTGDEDVMWIFASRLPKPYLMIALRGLYSTPLGGYGWHPHRDDGWPSVGDFEPAVNKLLGLISRLEKYSSDGNETSSEGESIEHAFSRADFSTIDLLGFSQGAALSYTLALTHPEKVRLLGGLSGFLPDEVERIVQSRPLLGKSFFVTHGAQDNLVPIARARWSVETLEEAGAQVIYCEDDVGHKLSAKCFQAMEDYFVRETAMS